MGSVLFIVSFSCPSFHDYLGYVSSCHQTTSYLFKFLSLPHPLFTRGDFAQSDCFSVCLLFSCAASHILVAHAALAKKQKYAWSSDPPRLLKGSRSSSAERELCHWELCHIRPLHQDTLGFVRPEQTTEVILYICLVSLRTFKAISPLSLSSFCFLLWKRQP